MKIQINPSKACGKIKAPPSKSMAHRALILGALTEKSVIENIDFSADIIATLNCLKALGTNVEIDGDCVTIGGFNIDKIPDNAELYCNESGSTLRFLLPFCMLANKAITLKGSKRLIERPLSIYEEIAKEQNIMFKKTENSVTVCGKMKPQEYFVKGDISSQFITGLMLAFVSSDAKVTVTGKKESASYIDLTLECMKNFGVIENSKPKNTVYEVEGDCSNAAFLEAFNYLGGDVTVEGLKTDTLQGDRVYKYIFEGLKNGEKSFDLSDCPDLAPICFAVAAALGGCKFTGTRRLKIKESDRANAMKTELSKFGIEVLVEEDSVTVKNGKIRKPNEILNGHNDHRIVMALSVLLILTGGEIEGAEAISKSYPSFFEDLSKLGIEVTAYDAE